MQGRSMIRWFSVLVLLSMVTAFCGGCAMFVPTPEPVTISFVYPEYGNIGQYEDLAQQFQEEYPYITVELHSTENVSLNAMPDYDAFTADHYALPAFIEQKAILNLDSFIEQDQDMDMGDFYTGVAGAMQSQGRTWGLPQGVNMLMFFYNKDVFDSFGASYPQLGWTWSDFLDVAFSVNDPADRRYAYGMHQNNDLAVYEPIVMIYQFGGGIFDDLDNPTRITFDTPENITAMEFYQALIYDHHVAPSPDDSWRLGSPYPWRAIYEGNVAMWTMMYAERGGVTMPMEWEFNWGMMPLPRGVTNMTMASVTGMYVSSQTEHPEEAYMWIDYVSQQQPPLLMPARRSQAQSSAYENLVGYEVAEAARSAMEGAVVVNPRVMSMGQDLDMMWGVFETIRNGETTADIALSTAQEQIE